MQKLVMSTLLTTTKKGFISDTDRVLACLKGDVKTIKVQGTLF